MSNGLNAILGGFETSHHVLIKRGFFRQYFIAMAMSLLLSFLLLFTVAIIVVFEVFIQSLKVKYVLSDKIPLIQVGRYVFVAVMILVTTSILFKFGTKHTGKRSFITAGSIFTTVLVIIISYFFGIWVIQFSQYNELYGSIGTLLIVMFYIWLNIMLLLMGFELDSAIYRIRRKNLFT
jgi:membrane protein